MNTKRLNKKVKTLNADIAGFHTPKKKVNIFTLPTIKETDNKEHLATFSDGTVYVIKQTGWRKIRGKK